MFFRKKDNQKQLEDARLISDKVDEQHALLAENQPEQVPEAADETPSDETSPQEQGQQQQILDEVEAEEPPVEVSDAITQTEPAENDGRDGESPEDVLNNFDLYIIAWINFGQPTSVPLTLGIGFNFVPQEEYIPTAPFEETPAVPLKCVPPPGTMDFESFLNLLFTYGEGSGGFGEGGFGEGGFLEQFGGADNFNISISVDDINELDFLSFLITIANLGMDIAENNNEIEFAGNFTIFLGDNTFNFDDLDVGFSQFFDGNTDLDFYLNDNVSLNILGCGCENTVIDANNESRIFDFWNRGEVTIQGVEMTGGAAFDYGEAGIGLGPMEFEVGGAIRSAADLTLIDSCVVDNCAYDGGGIFTYDEPWDFGEGGDRGEGSNSLTLVNSVVLDNKAMYAGGGIYGEGSDIFITQNSRVNVNYAGVDLGEGCELILGENGVPQFYEETDGGGIYIRRGDLLVESSEVNGNITSDDGGGIYARDADVEVINSSVNFNRAYGDDGGGIYISNEMFFRPQPSFAAFNLLEPNGHVFDDALLTIDNSTVDWNRAEDFGGGIYFRLESDYSREYELMMLEQEIDEVPQLEQLNGNDNGNIPDEDFHLQIINGSSVSFNRLRGGEGEGGFEFERFNGFDYDGARGAGLYQEGGTSLIDHATFDGNIITPAYVLGDEDIHDVLDLILENPLPHPLTDEYIEEISDEYFEYLDEVIGGGQGAGIHLTSGDFSGMGGRMYIFDSTISRNLEGRFFFDEESGAGIYNDNSTIEIIKNTIISQNQSLGDSDGGGIYNNGYIYLIDTTQFIDNYAGGWGGAIYNSYYEDIDIIYNSLFQGNMAGDNAGAIYNSGFIEDIVLTTFDSNIARLFGGGIYNEMDINTINRSIFSQNEAGRDGGGILNSGGDIINQITQSLFYANRAEDGAGIINYGTIDRIQNNTFSENVASTDRFMQTADGGAIYHTGLINDFSFNTVVFNRADKGAGIGTGSSSSGLYMESNIIVFNTDTPFDNNFDNDDDLDSYVAFGTAFVSNGYNIFGNVDGAYSTGTTQFVPDLDDLVGVDPLFGPLADNGGPTMTHALLIMSPAIDLAIKGPIMDQRGFSRPIGDDPDTGAYEFGSTMPPVIYPIVFDLDGDGVELISAQESNVTLNDADGQIYNLGWVSGDDALLVYDKNHDGIVNHLSEIELSGYHPDANTDLEGLQLAFDTNFDSLFNSMDDEFSSFGIWNDANEDGVTDAGEYQTLAEAGILELDLSAVESVQWVEGNVIFAEGLFTDSDGQTGNFADVALSKSSVLDDNIQGIDSMPTATFSHVEDLPVIDAAPMGQDAMVEQAVQEIASNNDLA